MLACRLQQNLSMRQSLILQLGLKSEFFDSVLVRSEALLKYRRYQRGLRLVKGLAERDNLEYRAVQDFLLAVLAPSWRARIASFYRGGAERLAVTETWETIDAIDRAMALALEELAALYSAYCALGWREGVAAPEYEELTAAGLRMFLQPRFPVDGTQEHAMEAA